MNMTRDDWLFVVREALKSDEVRELIAWAIDCSTEEREEQAYHAYRAAALNAIIGHRSHDLMGEISIKNMVSDAEDFAREAIS